MQDRDVLSDLADKFMLRLPEGMRAAIASEAKRNGRSMNSEIVAHLMEKFGEGTAAELAVPRVELLMEEQRDLLTQILGVLKGEASGDVPGA